MEVEETRTLGNDDGSGFAQAQQALQPLRWKSGIDLPPFVESNHAAMQLLASLREDTIDAPPSIDVSDAVALQIYRLVVGSSARRELWDELYCILASLVLRARVRVVDVDPKRCKSLRDYFMRKKGGSTATAGLVQRFTERINSRKRDGTLPDDADEARTALLLEWDRVPFTFSFPAAAASSSGGDGGGGGGGGDGGG